MVIYADILFLVNLYIDFFLLECVKRFLHLHINIKRQLLGAVVGAVCSLTALLPVLNGLISTLLGILCAFIIMFVVLFKGTFMLYIKAAVAYWVCSFIFAGFFLFISNMLPTGNLTVRNGTVYFGISPVLLFVFTVLAYIAIVFGKRVLGNSEPDSRYIRLIIENMGISAELYAKADTGNSLKEPFSSLPVIVAEKDPIKKLLPKDFSSGEQSPDVRLIPYSTITSDGLLYAFKAHRVYVKGNDEKIECYIAVCDRKLSANSFNAVFNPDILNNLKGNSNETN